MLDSDFWKKYFEVYDVLDLLIPYRELLESICEELDIKEGEKILEAGCGSGNLVRELTKRGAQVTGLDYCKEALEVCKKKNPEAKIVFGDLTKPLPFLDNYFDKIACNNALYTIPKGKHQGVLKELKRVLKPGGRIAISNPKKGWKPFEIYTYGIKQDFQQQGILRTIIKVIKMIIPTIKILYYNSIIKKQSQYYFFGQQEQGQTLALAGFSNISDPKPVYANQAILSWGNRS